MKISVLLPTLFPDLVRSAIEALRPQLRDVDHEFVIVSPMPVTGDNVRWFAETERRGPLAATQIAFERAQGDLMLITNDDFHFSNGAIAEALTAFAAPARDFPLALTYPHRMRAMDCVHTVFGRLHPSVFATGRGDAAHVGGVFDPSYRQAYGDPDYGMRLWAAGGKVRAARAHIREIADRECVDAAPRNQAAIDADWARFRERWGPHFDPIWGTEATEACLMIAASALPVLSPGAPDTFSGDGRAAARDLRIARAMTLVAYHNSATISSATIEAGLKYFVWASKLSGKPLQVYVADWYRAGVTLLPG